MYKSLWYFKYFQHLNEWMIAVVHSQAILIGEVETDATALVDS